MGTGHDVQSHSLWKGAFILSKEGGYIMSKMWNVAYKHTLISISNVVSQINCCLVLSAVSWVCFFLTNQLGLNLDVFSDPKTHIQYRCAEWKNWQRLWTTKHNVATISSGGKRQISNSLWTCEWGGLSRRISKDINILQTHTLDTHSISWQHLAGMLAKPLADNLLSGLINALVRWMNGEMCQFYGILLCLLVFLLPWCFPFMTAKGPLS